MGGNDYLGHYPTVVDESGRITMPRRFRDLIESLDHLTWTVTRGYQANLYLYNREQWENVVACVQILHPMDPKAHRLLRTIYGCAMTTHIDRQGRLPIPQQLRDLARLGREVVLVGMKDHLELWSKDGWIAFQDSMGPEMEQLANELLVHNKPLGFSEERGGPNNEH